MNMRNKNKYWTVQAFYYKDGKYELQEFVSGFAHKQAGDYFRQLHDTNEYAKLTMEPMGVPRVDQPYE
tara:strand:+ start:56 stop:259 length:204 start_codon:yes stop_codon:yes gene_type:complete